MSNPLVSILMTAFNREKYIAEAIESVLSSSYHNWELIISDDCSTDQSYQIACGYAAKDERIKVYRNDTNVGDYPNRNKSASLAVGKYLKYLDSDDLIYKYSLQYMIDAMEKYSSAGLGISFNRIDDSNPYPALSNPEQTYHDEYLGKSILGCGPSAAIIKREVFERFGGFSGAQYYGDHELWLIIGAEYPIVKLQPSLVWWRIHVGQQIVMEYADIMTFNTRFHHSLTILEKSTTLFHGDEVVRARKRIKQNYARKLLRILLYERKLSDFSILVKKSGLSFIELIRGLKGYA